MKASCPFSFDRIQRLLVVALFFALAGSQLRAVASAQSCGELFAKHFSALPPDLDAASNLQKLLSDPRSTWSKQLQRIATQIHAGASAEISYATKRKMLLELFIKVLGVGRISQWLDSRGFRSSDREIQSYLDKKLLTEGVDAIFASLGIQVRPSWYGKGLSEELRDLIREHVSDPVNSPIDEAASIAFINFASILTANRFERSLALEFKPLTASEREIIRTQGYGPLRERLREKYGKYERFRIASAVFDKTLTIYFMAFAMSFATAEYQMANSGESLSDLPKHFSEEQFRSFWRLVTARDSAWEVKQIGFLMEGRIRGYELDNGEPPSRDWVIAVLKEYGTFDAARLQGLAEPVVSKDAR